MADLNAMVWALAKSRAEAAAARQAVAEARKAWEASHAEELASAAAAEEQVTLADAALRAAVLETFKATGDVAPVLGCKVVQRTVLDYTEAEALAWAKSSGLALKLDVKAFEKVAKATAIPGVTVRQEPSVTVATDLDAVLTPASA